MSRALPNSKKVLQGTFKKCRAPKNEAKPATVSEIRNPPAHLNKWAKQYWYEVVHELVDTGVLTVVDWETFTRCCDAHGLYMEAREAVFSTIDEEGKKVKRGLAEYMRDRNSQTCLELNTMHKFNDTFYKYAVSLGLNPVARNKIETKEHKQVEIDPVEQLWEKKNGNV